MPRTPLSTSCRLHRWLAPALLLAAALPALAQRTDLGSCGDLHNAYGPFDYRTDRDRLPIVETHHFSSAVEQLIRGVTGSIGGDLDYTLRAFPNHHRALNAISRYGERLKSEFIPGAPFTVECYFIRAVNHRPDDATVRMLYATYLKGQRRIPEAVQQLEFAEKLAGDTGFTHYNIGLVYMDLGEPAAALREAHLAMALGFTRPELKDRLIAINKWVEPPPAAASSPEAASAPASR